MKTLAILSQKGGVGKTTLALCLAVAAEHAGKRTAVLDLDPQATASFWHDIRESDTPAVASLQLVRLPAVLKAAEQQKTDLAVIDGAAVARDITFEAAKAADYVFIPMQPAVFDVVSMRHTIDIVRQLKKPFSIVLTFAPPSGQEITDAEEAAGQLKAPLCPVRIGRRKAHFRAQSQGLAVQEYQPTSKAAEEIQQLYDYMCIHLYPRRKRRHG